MDSLLTDTQKYHPEIPIDGSCYEITDSAKVSYLKIFSM